MSGRPPGDLLADAAGRHPAHATGNITVITAEYKGKSYSFRADGWFNATVAAKKYGKEPYEWQRLPDTKRYLAALGRQYEPGKSRFVETRRGGNTEVQGTWLHPKLAIAFTRWLDMEFSIWADAQIDAILRNKFAASQAQRLSTFKERRPLYDSALDMVGASGMLFGEAYQIINAVAGTNHLDEITVENLEITIPPVKRLGAGTATPQDHARVDKGMIEIYGVSSQLALPLHDPPDED